MRDKDALRLYTTYYLAQLLIHHLKKLNKNQLSFLQSVDRFVKRTNYATEKQYNAVKRIYEAKISPQSKSEYSTNNIKKTLRNILKEDIY
jgi:hypothetical protein